MEELGLDEVWLHVGADVNLQEGVGGELWRNIKCLTTHSSYSSLTLDTKDSVLKNFQCTQVLLSTNQYYFSVLLSTTQVLLSNTQYYSVLLNYYSVLLSTHQYNFSVLLLSTTNQYCLILHGSLDSLLSTNKLEGKFAILEN